MDSQTAARSTESLFAEEKEAFALVGLVTDGLSSTEEKDKALARLRKIFDNYLECPSLLDPHLEVLINKLLETSREFIFASGSKPPCNLSHDQCSHSFSTIYAISKVRGRKIIQRLLPHEARDVEPVLQALQQMLQEANEPTSQQASINNADQPQRWESLFVLWNWMGTLSLVPFDCSVVLDNSQSLVSTLIDLGKTTLKDPGPTRDAAASCLAKWLSRPDLENSELPKFLHWSRKVIQDSTSGVVKQQFTEGFLILGILQTLVTILKVSTADRERLLQSMECLWEPLILLA